MKIPYTLIIVATILFVALGVTSVLLDFAVRDLRISVAAQEDELHAADGHILELTKVRQSLEQKIEAQEEANDALRKKVNEKQLAVQTQQALINQGTQISQQVGPALLHDVAVAAGKNDKLKVLLTRLGYTIQTK